MNEKQAQRLATELALRSSVRSEFVKTAALSDWQPYINRAGIGAGVGGLGTLLVSKLMGRKWKDALWDSLIGAGVGGVAGAGSKFLPDLIAGKTPGEAGPVTAGMKPVTATIENLTTGVVHENQTVFVDADGNLANIPSQRGWGPETKITLHKGQEVLGDPETDRGFLDVSVPAAGAGVVGAGVGAGVNALRNRYLVRGTDKARRQAYRPAMTSGVATAGDLHAAEVQKAQTTLNSGKSTAADRAQAQKDLIELRRTGTALEMLAEMASSASPGEARKFVTGDQGAIQRILKTQARKSVSDSQAGRRFTGAADAASKNYTERLQNIPELRKGRYGLSMGAGAVLGATVQLGETFYDDRQKQNRIIVNQDIANREAEERAKAEAASAAGTPKLPKLPWFPKSPWMSWFK